MKSFVKCTFELAGGEPVVDGGGAVAGQLYDLLCVQNVRVAFKLGQIIRLQPLRGGRFPRSCACGESKALRVFFKLPEEDSHIFLFDFIPQPSVGAVNRGPCPADTGHGAC